VAVTEQSITFEIPGAIIPKERPRFSGHAYTSKRTKGYETHIRGCAMAALAQWRIDGRTNELKPERGHRHWNAVRRFSLNVVLFMQDRRRRDLDNCIKSICDALNGMLWDDDAQIDELYAFRRYDKDNPRAIVTVSALSHE